LSDQTEGRSRRWKVPVVIGGTVALLLGTAATAFALVSPAPNVNTIGAGGYDVGTPGVTGNQEVINADQYGLTLAGGRQGVKMCNSSSNETSAIGLFSSNLNTDYAVQYGAGVVTCQPAGQLPAGNLNTFPGLAAVPFGHHVWVNETLVQRVKRVKLLICVLFDLHHHVPVPNPTESVANPTASPETSTANPTASATASVANPTASATETPTVTPVTPAPTPSPTRTYNHDPGLGNVPGVQNILPGFTLRCHIVVRTFAINRVVFEAQDLDAPTVTPTAGDLAGVQFASVPVPAGTTFDHAVWGASENLTSLVACSGAGFPIPINTPGLTANYASAACQPLSVGEYATYNTGATVNPLSGPATITEVISPSAGGALMAPNGSLTSTNLGPHGTASDASLTGGHFVTFSANAPVS
jgi:hypothetical protein